MAALLDHCSGNGQHLIDHLLSRGEVTSTDLYDAVAAHWNTCRLDLQSNPPDPGLLHRIDPAQCLRSGILPWRRVGGITLIVSCYPDRFPALQQHLAAEFGPLVMAVAPFAEIEAALLIHLGSDLAFASETRVAAHESCREMHAPTLRKAMSRLLLVLAGAILLAPVHVLLMMFGLAFAAMFSYSLLKLAALLLALRDKPRLENPPVIARLPMVTVMVAMYREADIAGRLTARLGLLDYPTKRLEILLVVEEEDDVTRQALARTVLPVHMRVVVVPKGSVKTKPRALNYALSHCRGSIVGIYDAEDAPEPDQIRKVVQRFHEVDGRVVCLQGILDFYNPHSNWLARCFSIEYAAWFRVFLPALQQLGLALPLGGTTLFFRKAALEELGGWDAQNVTEDADLGVRLARHGFRTELIASTTHEEANCRAFPWVKQRSRWIKGYMMTWLSHMRAPARLWRELGARKFVGFQVLFLGSILQSLLAPLVWSLWLVPFGVWHPVPAAMSPAGFTALYMGMFAITLLTMSVDLLGLRRAGHPIGWFWVPTLAIYHMMATLAAYKALWELLTRPFYWDKTSHGHFDT